MMNFASMILLSSLYLFLVFLPFPSPCDGMVLCQARERDALLQFKRGITRDERGLLSSWDVLSEEDCCRWNGITCDNRTGHVIELLLNDDHVDMDANGDVLEYYIGGQINPSLVELKFLQKLELASIDFGVNPVIPEFFGSFENLRYLNISRGNFSGVIPRQIGNLARLETLDFSHNDYISSDGLWLSNISSLRYLDMSYTNLSKASRLFEALGKSSFISYIDFSSSALDPRSLEHANFTRLSSLNLRYNEMDFHLPNWLVNMTSLRSLELGQNHMVHIDGDITGSLCNVRRLSLPETKISGGSLDNLFMGCNGHPGLVYLDLWDTINVTGHLPTWIGECSSLEYLDIGHNMLSGSIPAFLSGLQSLKELYLSENSYSGNIPAFLWNLPSCQRINLSGNNFNGTLPSSFGILRKILISLDLSFNKLTGSIPESIFSMQSLEYLDLCYNNFSGIMPASLGNPSITLTYLDLSFNKFSGSIPDFLFSMQSLQYLNLCFNNISGRITEVHFHNLTNIEKLYLCSTRLELMVSPNWVPSFRNLQYFDMGSCMVGPLFPPWLQNLSGLVYLNLSDSGISDAIPQWIWSFSPVMRVLDLSVNNITGMVPSAVNVTRTFESIALRSNKLEGFVSSFPSAYRLVVSNNSISGPLILKDASALNMLSLSHNKLTGVVPSSLCDAYYLQVLDLSDNYLSGQLPSCLGRLCLADENVFASLQLYNNKLKGNLPLSLMNCKNMSLLDIGGNRFSGTIPSWISSNLQQLQVLRLRSNFFHGGIPSQLSQLGSLQVLDLASNNLSGSIPPTFGNFSAMKENNLQNRSFQAYRGNYYKDSIPITFKDKDLRYSSFLELLKSMDLSGNRLSGVIPPEMGNLTGLINLNLSRNSLTGSIPVSFGNLMELQSLDLSRNHIDGVIPTSLANLTYLSMFNVSFNNLSGTIPTGTQLGTFPYSSYMGNPFLCGYPLKDCKVDDFPSFKQDYKKSTSVDFTFFYIGTAFGFIVGFWTFCGVLFFKRSWRFVYYGFLDDLCGRFYLRIASFVRN